VLLSLLPFAGGQGEPGETEVAVSGDRAYAELLGEPPEPALPDKF